MGKLRENNKTQKINYRFTETLEIKRWGQMPDQNTKKVMRVTKYVSVTVKAGMLYLSTETPKISVLILSSCKTVAKCIDL